MENIKSLYQLFLQHPQIITDSRLCQPGSLFFALKGDKFNGNDFAIQALEKGCNYAVVDEPSLKGKEGMIWVDDVLQTLQLLANYHRKQLAIPIIGITGTNGKTTTKELTYAVLSQKYKTYATKGNLNNHIGVPLTLLSMNASTEIGIVEMGANHIGEIEKLCDIADPDFGIITNIGQAHLEGFGSYEGVKKTKNELYKHIAGKKGLLFVNADDKTLLELSNQIERKFYSESASNCSVNAKNVRVSPYLNFTLKDCNTGKEAAINTSIVGKYNVYNALAAACAGKHFGIDLQLIAQAISSYNPTNNRSQLIETSKNKIVMDAYNANPSSMKVAVENFDAIDHPNKTVILGGMKELGASSQKAHNELFEMVQSKDFSGIYLLGEEFEAFSHMKGVQWFTNSETLAEQLQDKPLENSLILVKGSRSNKLEIILPYL
jgi:UDP-N-acetylmuramoyl-tripeptide--D-alanyl-D-alanine ligase